MRLHRLLILVPLAAELLVPALAFAAGEAEGGDEAAAAMERTTFDHEWNDIRFYNHIADYTAATGNTITSFSEAPMLAEMVAAGDLAPVEERLPDDPYVVVPYQEIGQYGGYAFMGRDGTGHWGDAHLLIGIEQLNRIAGDLSTQSPNVATDYELSADAKVLTVTLREGIKWSTGEPFTTEDIKFWYEDIILNEELTPNPAKFLQPGGELMKMNFLDDQTFQFSFAIPNPVAVEWLSHPNRGVMPIKQAKHYFSQFHPNYVGAEKAAALAKEAGFENWVQHFGDKNNSWSELPKFNTERPMLTAYRLAEIGTDRARWERNPYYWKIDVEGNQLPYMDGINVFLPQRPGWENPWGNQWALWYVIKGESGIEPPDEVKRNLKLRNFPERGGHDWSIGSWTGPQHPSQFYLMRTESTVFGIDSGGSIGGGGSSQSADPSTGAVLGQTRILTTRMFAEQDQIHYDKHPAYGLIIFLSASTEATKQRYIGICKGFVSSLVDTATSSVDLEEQMVTLWPTKEGEAESLNSKSHDGEDIDSLCTDAVAHIDLEFSLEGKGAVETIVNTHRDTNPDLQDMEIKGVGPYVIAWSQYCSSCMLFLNLSKVLDVDEATKMFQLWREHIVMDPSYWNEITSFKIRARQFGKQVATKIGDVIDVQEIANEAVGQALQGLFPKADKQAT